VRADSIDSIARRSNDARFNCEVQERTELSRVGLRRDSAGVRNFSTPEKCFAAVLPEASSVQSLFGELSFNHH
jgi:hypothetical protein